MKKPKNIIKNLAFTMIFCLVGGIICASFGLIQGAFAKPNEANIEFDSNGRPIGANLKFFDNATDGSWYPGYEITKEYIFKNPSSTEKLKIENFGIDNLNLIKNEKNIDLKNIYARDFLNNMSIVIESKTDKNSPKVLLFKGSFQDLLNNNSKLDTVELQPSGKTYVVYTIKMKEEAGNTVANLSSSFDFSYQLTAIDIANTGDTGNTGDIDYDDDNDDNDEDDTSANQVAKVPEIVDIEDEGVALSDGLEGKDIKRIIHGGAKKSQLRLEDSITLPEAVSILARAVDLNSDKIIKETFKSLQGKWFKEYAEIGVYYKLISKDSLNRLNKPDTVTQKEFFAMLAQTYMISRPADKVVNLDESKKRIDEYTKEYFSTISNEKALSRKSIANMLVDKTITAEFLPTIKRGSYNLNKEITRGEAFELIYDLLIKEPIEVETVLK